MPPRIPPRPPRMPPRIPPRIMPPIPPSASTASTHASSHTSTHHASHTAILFDGNLFNLHFLSADSHCSHFEQCISRFLLVKSDEAKVFGLTILHTVNWSLDLNNLSILRKMLPNDIFRDGGVTELADVDLALF